MTVFYSTLNASFLGYTAIFLCVAAGFFFLRGVGEEEVGPGFWALSFLLNAAGFLFWSGALPLPRLVSYLIGEILHIAGFFSLADGAYRFCGYRVGKRNAAATILWIALWIASLLLIDRYPEIANIALKGLRALLLSATGIIILRSRLDKGIAGRRLSGFSLLVWGAYQIALSFIHVKNLLELSFGLLVGFQILGALGLLAMFVDRIRQRAMQVEKRVKRLEGLLPICSYCKKIRDKGNNWHTLEAYIEDHSKAEFSHGVCPECMKKHRSDWA
jgi:hypothetical protein